MDPIQGVTYDEALVKRVGQFGPGQWRTLSAASLCLFGNAAAFFFWVFATINPVTQHHWECMDPSDMACQAVKHQEVPSSADFCALSPGSTRWTNHDSLVANFNLVCSDAWKVQFTNSLMFMGALVGSGSFGFLCDRFGRRRPLFLATGVITASMFASLAAPSYWVFAVLRAVSGFGAAGQSHCNFLLSTEPVGPAYRGIAGILVCCFWIAGEFMMVLLGFALPAWRHLLLACACINAAVLLLYPIVPESGRWLLSQHRTEAALQCLQRTAKANRSQMPTEPLVSSRSSKQLNADLESAAVSQQLDVTGSIDDSSLDEPEMATLANVLHNPRLAARFGILLIANFTIMANYYGISMGAGGIPGSVYTTFAIGAAAEAFAMLMVAPAVDRLGRHNVVSLGLLLGGAACLACANVKSGITQAALAAVGKFGCSASQPVMAMYIAELLPTPCRSSLIGICSQASRVGSITAPFLLMMGAQLSLGKHSPVFIPFTVFGCLALFSGLLILTMPETSGASMPESVADLETLLSVFTAKPWRGGCSALLAFVFRTRAVGRSRQRSRQSTPVNGANSRSSCSTCDGSSSSMDTVDVEAHVSVGVTANCKSAKSTVMDSRNHADHDNS